MNTDTEILTGKKCPYCGNATIYMDSSHVFNGSSYGMIYACIPCDARVGVHKGTDKALGRLANHALREAKKRAHLYFDPLWMHKMKIGNSKNYARNKAYKWLAGELGIKKEYCHIGMFDVEQCNKVVEICKKYYKNLN